MNTKYLLPKVLCLACIWLACKKEAPKQYSYWTINGQEYSSNNVDAEEGHNRPYSSFGSHDHVRFDMSFKQGYLPIEGSWTLITPSTIGNPDRAYLAFYIDTVAYAPSEYNTSQLEPSAYNSKARYSLGPTWFINFHHPTADSLLIEGTFNEP